MVLMKDRTKPNSNTKIATLRATVMDIKPVPHMLACISVTKIVLLNVQEKEALGTHSLMRTINIYTIYTMMTIRKQDQNYFGHSIMSHQEKM